MNRRYEKTQGYWVYAHTTPDGMHYIGISQQQPNQRWKPSEYKGTALYQYIEQYGWENMSHTVLLDNLTKEQAEQLEDQFITELQMNGLCINKQRSGGHWRDNDEIYKEQQKTYRKVNREEIREQKKVYYEANREKILEQQKAYEKQHRNTPEGKIYNRVKGYNQTHTPIETPMMAKLNYIMLGIVPWYIKNDDLI